MHRIRKTCSKQGGSDSKKGKRITEYPDKFRLVEAGDRKSLTYSGQRLPKEEACRMMFDMGVKLSGQLGIKTEGNFRTFFDALLLHHISEE